MTERSEDARQWVHIGSVSFALLLRYLNWWEGAVMAGAALVFNLLVLPHVGGRRLYRDVDHARGFPLGILLYPIAVLLVILLFPSRLDIAAAAWAVLAIGDGTATLVGTRAGGPRWPWNRDKTIAGSLAFAVFGAAGAVCFACWTRPSIDPLPPLAFSIAAPIAAAIAAALVETIPVKLDDNISVTAAAAGVLFVASHVTRDAIARAWPSVAADLPWAVGLNIVVAWLGHRARTVSTSGAIVGAVVGILIYAGGGRNAWFLLLATLVVASVASRAGLKRKVILGIEEERGGRRGPGNAIANCGVATIAACAAATTPNLASALVAFTAALTAGGSDTVASEIGKAWGRSTFLVTTFGRVRAGTPGAMSLEGTAAGIVAALGLASLAAALGLIGSTAIVAVVVAATAGALVESALGATLEAPGILNNDMLNFINTAVAAAVAIALT